MGKSYPFGVRTLNGEDNRCPRGTLWVQGFMTSGFSSGARRVLGGCLHSFGVQGGRSEYLHQEKFLVFLGELGQISCGLGT